MYYKDGTGFSCMYNRTISLKLLYWDGMNQRGPTNPNVTWMKYFSISPLLLPPSGACQYGCPWLFPVFISFALMIDIREVCQRGSTKTDCCYDDAVWRVTAYWYEWMFGFISRACVMNKGNWTPSGRNNWKLSNSSIPYKLRLSDSITHSVTSPQHSNVDHVLAGTAVVRVQ